MPYGDAILDSIMQQVNPQNRPQGRITQTSNFGAAPVAPGAPVAPPAAEPTGFGYKAGRFLGRYGAKFLGPIAGADQLVSGVSGAVLDGPTTGNAIRTGVGAASLFSPPARAVATGMSLADMAGNLAGPSILNAADRANDITGPATKEFLARGGMKPMSAVAAPGDTGRDDTLIDPTAGALPPPEALASPYNSVIPPRGTGFIRNNTTGAVTNIDSRGGPGYGAVAPTQAPGFTGALLRLKQVSGDNALATARSTAAAHALSAQGTYMRGAAAQGTLASSAGLAAEHLKQNPGDYAGAAAIIHGRAAPGGNFKEVVGALPDKNGAVTVLEGRTGAVKKVTPQSPPISEENISASMRARGMTREQAIAAYKAAGHDVSRLK